MASHVNLILPRESTSLRNKVQHIIFTDIITPSNTCVFARVCVCECGSGVSKNMKTGARKIYLDLSFEIECLHGIQTQIPDINFPEIKLTKNQ